jgi:hypothetical protein
VPSSPQPLHAYLRTLLLCLVVGGAMQAAGVPLGWMIGSLLAGAWLASRRAAAVPRLARPGGLVVLGLGLGQTFTAPVLGAVTGALPAILAGGLLSILAGAALSPLYRRIARSDARTAFFATIPGGIMTMAVLAGRAGASVPAVTLAQSLRMGLVVLVYPPMIALAAGGAADAAFTAALPPVSGWGLALLLAGGAAVALAGERAGVANAAMLAPCLLAMALSAGGVLPSSVPRWMVDGAQVAMGMSLGERFGREGLGGGPRRIALASIASAGALVLLLVVSGLLLGFVAGLPMVAVVLGLAPGGMPEMAVTAKALDLAVPLVLGFHLVRAVLCNVIVSPLWALVKVCLKGENTR